MWGFSMLKKVLSLVFYYIQRYEFKKRWRRKNTHNLTAAENDINDFVSVGNYTYGVINAPYLGGKITIGNYCSIADNVAFLSGGEHYINHFSSFPFYGKMLGGPEPAGGGEIVISDDVWIGYGAIILSGVHIGQGAIIGAGTIVAKDIPPYAIFAGGRIIKYRFTEDIIQKLLKFDYSRLTKEDIEKNIDLLYRPVDNQFFEKDFYKRYLRDEKR